MPAPQRRPEPGVIDRLLAEPWRFDFVQAVRLLERWLRDHGAAPDPLADGWLRFQNSVSLSFPPSQLEALDAEADADASIACEAELLAALRSGRLRALRLTPAFIGLLGVSGVLPLHYTESVAARLHWARDAAPRALFDVFSSRAVALFYEACGANRPQLRRDGRGRAIFLPLQLALAGVSAPPVGMRAEVVARYAALLRQRPVGACTISAVLTDYFGVPCVLEQWIGCWDEVPPAHQARLGVNAVLGRGALLGAQQWRRDLRVRVRIGPLRRAEFEELLPDRPGAVALAQMIALFAAAPLEYEVQLVLRADAVRPARLGDPRGEDVGTRLGWDAFMEDETAIDRDDVRYELAF